MHKLVPDPPWPQSEVSPLVIRASSSATCETDETRKQLINQRILAGVHRYSLLLISLRNVAHFVTCI
jgi:hypothetical protein